MAARALPRLPPAPRGRPRRPPSRLLAALLLMLTLLLPPEARAQETVEEDLEPLTDLDHLLRAGSGSGEEEGQAVLPAAPVTNLSVHYQLSASSLTPDLRLNISWTPPAEDELPEGMRLPRGFIVNVLLLNATSADCTTHARSATFHATHLDNPENRTVLVPDEPMPGSLRVRPGCAYNVTVESEPYLGGPLPHKEYLVPTCVDMCRCRAPPPELDLRMERLPGGDLNVTWSPYPPRNASAPPPAAVHRVHLELGEGRFTSNANQTVFERMWNTTVPPLPAHCQLPASALHPGAKYRLQGRAEDADGCLGHVTAFLLPSLDSKGTNPESGAGTGAEVAAWAAVPATAALVLAAALCACSRCCALRVKLRDGRLRVVRLRRGAGAGAGAAAGVFKFSNADSHGMLSFPIHQERNIIYVEKEIEEAKARGDADTFEISYERLALGRQIGKGAFGRVFLAQAEAIAHTPGLQTVAVKKLKPRASADEVEEFLSEIAMLKKVGRHPNVVTMLGCCTLREPFCMIMEYVPCGDLLQYLRRLRVEYERFTWSSHLRPPSGALPSPRSPAPSFGLGAGPRYIDLLLAPDSEGSYVQPESHLSVTSGRPSIPETEWSLLSSEGEPQTPTEDKNHRLECVLDPKELQNFAVQIARGMAHLERKQITHRDLAARNVLIDENKTLKISDFGLSRTGIYVNTKRKKVPLRWLSVEAMRDNLYSSKSDVWAFAIVLWEIGTLGGFPYPTVADMNLLSFLMDGKRLEKPDNCSDELYSLMLQCWAYSPDARPSFAELVEHLDSVTCRKRVYVDFSNLSPNYTFPPTEQQT